MIKLRKPKVNCGQRANVLIPFHRRRSSFTLYSDSRQRKRGLAKLAGIPSFIEEMSLS